MGDTKNETGIRVIPPLVFIFAILVGVAGNYVWPIGVITSDVSHILGPVIIVVSVLITPPVLLSFKRAETSFDVRKSARSLVTSGLFRFSRNPGYVAMIALCVGIAITLDNAWMLVTVLAASIFLHFQVVLAEERHLEALFGEEYLDYKKRVRRWL